MTNKKITPDMVLKTLSDKPKIQADIARDLECYRSTPAKYLKQLEHDGKAVNTPEGWIKAQSAPQAEPEVEHVVCYDADLAAFVKKNVEIANECDIEDTTLLGWTRITDAQIVHERAVMQCLNELVKTGDLELVKKLDAHKRACEWLYAYADAVDYILTEYCDEDEED